MFAHKISQKNYILCDLCKNNQCSKVASHKFFFCADSTKISLSKENLCANITCLDVHPEFFFRIFRHLEKYLESIFHNSCI
jgi:hypothetical protein